MPSVSVYRNLHKDCWSLTVPGQKVQHADAVMVNNPRFVVQPAGNAKVRREHKKNVHAFVRGAPDQVYVISDPLAKGIKASPGLYDWTPVRYNPYENTTFVLPALADRPIITAKQALLMPNGKVYVEV